MKERILIIDDEEEILQLLAETLKEEGYDVVMARDGVEGMERFRSSSPDLVITDVRMPHLDGLGVLKEITKMATGVDVIVLTGFSDEATAIDCLRAGAYDYLLKPLEDLEILMVAVARAMNKRTVEYKNRELLAQLAEMAITDSLTGLFNFRHLDRCLEEEVIRSKRYGHTFFCVMLDIDHFKAINDTHGHLFGDFVLKELGKTILQNIRSPDRLFRYGGEEFFILMPETDRTEGIDVVNRIMDAVRKRSFAEDDREVHVTVSMGCTLFSDQSTEKRELMDQADRALYRAKNGGRDRVEVWESPGKFKG